MLLFSVTRITLLSQSCSTEDQIEETAVWFLATAARANLLHSGRGTGMIQGPATAFIMHFIPI
jgi:hypothetical protein